MDAGASRLRAWFSGVIGLISSGMLAGLFYRTWQRPLEFESGVGLPMNFALLGLELVSLFAGGFIYGIADPEVEINLNDLVLRGESHRSLRRRLLVSFTGIFAVAGGLIAWRAGSWWMLLGFWGMLISRTMGMLSGPDEVNRSQFQRFAWSLGLFLLALLLTAVVPVSHGGLTPEILAQLLPNRGSGLWTEHPERVLVLGLVYFSVVGVFEFIWALKSSRLVVAGPPD